MSADSVARHKQFVEKEGLKVRLISDEEKALIVPLGLWVEKSLYGKTYYGIERSTFLVGPEGTIEKVWRKVKPDGHAAEVLAAI